MIKVTLTNEILNYIMEIERNKYIVSSMTLSNVVANKLKKNSKKKSSFASTKIEGNPLTEQQVDEVIESDEHKHFLKPEQEVRNYFLALNYLEEKSKKKEKFSKKLILDVQKHVEKGASKERIGLRGPMNRPPKVRPIKSNFWKSFFMGKSKYTYEFKKQVVNDYLNNEGGYRYITAKYSVSDRKLVRQWVANYKKYGDSGLFRSRKKTVYSFKKKLDIVELYLSSELSYQEIALQEGIKNPSVIAAWVNR